MDDYPGSLRRYWMEEEEDDYPGSLRRYWMEEEEDDDLHFLVDDDEAEAATYNHLVQVESSTTRRRYDAPRKVIRPRDLPSGQQRGLPFSRAVPAHPDPDGGPRGGRQGGDRLRWGGGRRAGRRQRQVGRARGEAWGARGGGWSGWDGRARGGGGGEPKPAGYTRTGCPLFSTGVCNGDRCSSFSSKMTLQGAIEGASAESLRRDYQSWVQLWQLAAKRLEDLALQCPELQGKLRLPQHYTPKRWQINLSGVRPILRPYKKELKQKASDVASFFDEKREEINRSLTGISSKGTTDTMISEVQTEATIQASAAAGAVEGDREQLGSNETDHTSTSMKKRKERETSGIIDAGEAATRSVKARKDDASSL